MSLNKYNFTFSIVLETENLGCQGLKELEESLTSLKNQSIPLKWAEEIILVVSNQISSTTLSSLKEQYPLLTIHKVEEDLDYTGAKILGANVAKSDVVVYVDSDVRYDSKNIENLLSVFIKHPEADISAGSTIIEPTSPYALSFNFSWMITILPDVTKISKWNYFPFNNFAMKKDLFYKFPFPNEIPLYRSKITLWRKMFSEDIQIYKAPGTPSFHAPPQTFWTWWYRMLINGADVVSVADYKIVKKEIVYSPSFIKRFFKLFRLLSWKLKVAVTYPFVFAKKDKTIIKHLPLSFIFVIINLFVVLLGGLFAVFNTKYIMYKLQKLESEGEPV